MVRIAHLGAAATFAATVVAPSFAQDEGQTRVTPASIVEGAPESDWREVPADDLLVMDLPSGTIIIQLQPKMAPLHVERIKTLTRQGFYDGIIFHRVIDGFMAQGGDPTGTGTGGSPLPDLIPEFAVESRELEGFNVIGRDDRAAQIAFVDTIPVAAQAPTLTGLITRDGVAAWGMHCRGVMSMARATAPNSANSQFFLMFGDSRDGLDQGYTVWGKIVDGYRNARRINRGEPPPVPTPIVRMRIMSDIPEDERQRVEFLDPGSQAFADYVRATGAVTENGYVRDACGIDVPIRLDGEITTS